MYNITPYMQICCILHETANELFLFLTLHHQLTQNAWALEAKRDFADASQLDTLQEDQLYAFENSVLICTGNQEFTTSLLICAGWLAVLPRHERHDDMSTRTAGNLVVAGAGPAVDTSNP